MHVADGTGCGSNACGALACTFGVCSAGPNYKSCPTNDSCHADGSLYFSSIPLLFSLSSFSFFLSPPTDGFLIGVCDPQTGNCSSPSLPDGQSCPVPSQSSCQISTLSLHLLLSLTLRLPPFPPCSPSPSLPLHLGSLSARILSSSLMVCRYGVAPVASAMLGITPPPSFIFSFSFFFFFPFFPSFLLFTFFLLFVAVVWLHYHSVGTAWWNLMKTVMAIVVVATRAARLASSLPLDPSALVYLSSLLPLPLLSLPIFLLSYISSSLFPVSVSLLPLLFSYCSFPSTHPLICPPSLPLSLPLHLPPSLLFSPLYPHWE